MSTYEDPAAWARRVAWNLATNHFRKQRNALAFMRQQPASEGELIMNEHDDDLLISGAFRDFQHAAEPSVHPASSSAIRGLAVQRRRTRLTMLSIIGALVIADAARPFGHCDPAHRLPPKIVTSAIMARCDLHGGS